MNKEIMKKVLNYDGTLEEYNTKQIMDGMCPLSKGDLSMRCKTWICNEYKCGISTDISRYTTGELEYSCTLYFDGDERRSGLYEQEHEAVFGIMMELINGLHSTKREKQLEVLRNEFVDSKGIFTALHEVLSKDELEDFISQVSDEKINTLYEMFFED
jgi:hypothetical protein